MPDATLPEGIGGWCHERWAEVPQVLAGQLASGLHHGAAVAVYHRGEPVVDIWGGQRVKPDGTEEPWSERTTALSFSTTKGPAALALHMVLERHGIGYDDPVAKHWPEFGKEAITIRHVLCHEAGVPQIRGEVPDVSHMASWDEMVAMMERIEPLWEPGTENGYHAINFGWLVGELVRRIDGRDISTFLREEIAGPLGLDGCFIGTPEAEHDRVARLIPYAPPEGAPDLTELLGADSLIARALTPAGDMSAFVNSPQGLSTVAPAFSGVFTARSLARIYAALERGGALGGVRLLQPETLREATTVQNTRPDKVIIIPVHWRLGFMGGGAGFPITGPNPDSYGHAGFGGSVAFADPQSETAVALTLDKLSLDLIGGDRTGAVANAAVLAATA